MTPKQRYLATLAGQPVDHLARLPILMQFAAEHIGSNYGAFASDYRVLCEANIACAREFGIDQMNTMSDPNGTNLSGIWDDFCGLGFSFFDGVL